MIQTVREKFTCRDCERISPPPPPFHATPRGWAGPNLLATILFEKYGQHLPLNRQRDRYATHTGRHTFDQLPTNQVSALRHAPTHERASVRNRLYAAGRSPGPVTEAAC